MKKAAFAFLGVMFLWGCTDDDEPIPPPAPPGPPAPTLPVSVTVTQRGVVNTTVIAVFVDADGNMVKQGLVGAGGKAQALLPKGGIVHVIEVIDTSDTVRSVNIRSVRGVMAGDSLAFDSHPTRWKPFETTDLTFLGNFTPLAEAARYVADLPCGTGFSLSPPILRLSAASSCLPSSSQLLATATGATLPRPKYAWLTFDGTTGFTVPAFADMAPVTVQLQGMPFPPSSVEVRKLLPPYFDLAVAPHYFPQSLPAGDSTAAAFHPPSADSRSMFVEAWKIVSSGTDYQAIIAVTDGNATSATLNINALPVPQITGAAMISGKVVSWPQTGAGQPDLRAVTAVSRFSKSGKSTTVTWRVFSGDSTPTEELPGLPALFADIDPTQQLSSIPGHAFVSYVNYSNVANYDEARGKRFEGMMRIPELPAMGDAVYQARISRSHLYTE